MSQTREFDESVAYAADCYVAQLGSVEAAIEELSGRRSEDGMNGRANEAIAYLRYERGGDRP